MRKRLILWCAAASLFAVPGGLLHVGNSALANPDDDGAEANIDDSMRFVLPGRPDVPEPQHPPMSTTRNVDTGKPPHEWQRLTDDWFSLRPWLDDRGISFQANLTVDGTKNLTGGADTAGDAWRNLFNANVTLDLDRLAHWKGATIFTNFQNQDGRNGSELTGNALGISNIDADGRTQLSEFWFEQKLFEDKLRIKIGKVDASGEFGPCEHAADFISPSFTQTPNILGFPSYPDPATSVNVFVKPTEHCYASFGLYDGATHKGTNTGSYGPAKFFGAGLFLIGEGGAMWELGEKLNGRAGVGAWYDTSEFEKLSGGTESGARGAYLIVDQKAWRAKPDEKDNDRGISVFLRYGWADPDLSNMEHHLAVGLAWAGPLAARPDDILGLGVTAARFSGHAGTDEDYEVAIELFYKLRALKFLAIQPDLQYIHNPGGLRSQDDALAATIRMVVDF